jgi:hypothetical protein
MYPITYEADFNPTPNRWTTFFRLILAIPWMIVALVYLIAFAITHFVGWLAVVILGRYPEGLFNFNAGMIRFFVRTYAWVYLQTDAWPSFGIGDDPSYPIRISFVRPERQSRLKAFFRLILVIPLEIVLYLGVGYLHSGAAMVAWLTIVFRGYMPEGINNVLTFVNGLYARVGGYATVLTDDYPPIGLEAAKPSGGGVVQPSVPPAPPAPPAAPAV